MPGGTNVLQVSAFDKDEGLNGVVEYAILEGGDDHFEIDKMTGEIRSRHPLDRESRSEYRLLVLAFDQGAPSLNDTAVVQVTLSID